MWYCLFLAILQHEIQDFLLSFEHPWSERIKGERRCATTELTATKETRCIEKERNLFYWLGQRNISIPSLTRCFEWFSLQQNCVTGHLYLGIAEESADHFFYGTLSPVSLQKLLEVCNIDHKLPGALATIGFPEGLQVQTMIPLLKIERFSFECRKTKTKAITMTNHNKRKQQDEPIRTRS